MCNHGARLAVATVNVGATDFNGCSGYYHDLCDGHFYYASLGQFTNQNTLSGEDWIARALGVPGVLPGGYGLWITYHGKTAYAVKGDGGYGQGSGYTSDPTYAIDLHVVLAQYLNFPGKDFVTITNDKPGSSPTGVVVDTNLVVQDMDPSDQVRDIADQCAIHGSRAWYHAQYIGEFVRTTRYVDESGPRS